MAKTEFEKPRVSDGFPLSWHKGAGQWYRKFKGRFVYFGADADVAIQRYLKERDYLLAGVAIPNGEALTVRQMCNRYLGVKDSRRASGELVDRTFSEMLITCRALVDHFGDRAVFTMGPDDFEQFRQKITTKSPVVLMGRIVRTRSVFKFALENRLLERQVDFGTAFALPTKSDLRKHRAKQQKPLFSAQEIHWFLEGRADPEEPETFLRGADSSLKAWILLGLNCGLYASDISGMLHRHIDGEFLAFDRLKTGITRRCWLWPETQDAVAACCTDPKVSDSVFLSSRGRPLVVATKGDQRVDLVSSRFVSLKKRIKFQREAAGFKNFRHTLRTVADAAGDQPAIMLAMGHADSSISDHYRHGIDDERLRAVSQYVRAWLWPDADEKK